MVPVDLAVLVATMRCATNRSIGRQEFARSWMCAESLSKRNVQIKNLKGRVAEKEECVKRLEKDVRNANYAKNELRCELRGSDKRLERTKGDMKEMTKERDKLKRLLLGKEKEFESVIVESRNFKSSMKVVEEQLQCWQRRDWEEQQRMRWELTERERKKREAEDIKAKVRIEERDKVKRSLQQKTVIDKELAEFLESKKRRRCEQLQA